VLLCKVGIDVSAEMLAEQIEENGVYTNGDCIKYLHGGC
jgi:hypothetical protein